MIDYHLHTPLCRHAVGNPEQYLAEARRRGLSEIGFADHFPLALLGYTPQNEVTMDPGELPGYVKQIGELKENSVDITIKLGIEVDYLPGRVAGLAGLLGEYPFDYVIGSVHFIDDWDFTHPGRIADYSSRDLEEVYRRYFELVAEACRSGLFDIIGHIDVVKKFGFRPDGDLEQYWIETARVLKESGTCIELNSSGRDAPAGEFYPAPPFLELCRREGVPVTLGSDAHAPEQVGRHFTEAVALCEAAGYGELSVFTGRSRSTVKLGSG